MCFNNRSIACASSAEKRPLHPLLLDIVPGAMQGDPNGCCTAPGRTCGPISVMGRLSWGKQQIAQENAAAASRRIQPLDRESEL